MYHFFRAASPRHHFLTLFCHILSRLHESTVGKSKRVRLHLISPDVELLGPSSNWAGANSPLTLCAAPEIAYRLPLTWRGPPSIQRDISFISSERNTMKKLVFYTALAVLTITAGGCGRNWSSWFCRGEMCDNCEMGTVYSSDYFPSVESMPETLPPMRGN
jgi:hypothetical protein